MTEKETEKLELLEQLTRELEVSEERFLTFTNQLTDGVIIVNTKGIVQYANPSAAILFSQNNQELLGQPFRIPTPEGKKGQLAISGKDGKSIPVIMNTLDTVWKGEPLSIVTIRNIQAESTLKRQLNIEELANEISKRFLDTPQHDIDREIINSLRNIGRFIEADRSYIFLFFEDSIIIEKSYEWLKTGHVDQRLNKYSHFSLEPFKWAINKLQCSEILHIPSIAELPQEADPEKTFWLSDSVSSILAIPLIQNKKLMGLLGFNMITETKVWFEQDVTLLQLLGEIFISVLARKKAFEVDLQRQQELEYLVRVSTALRQAVTLQDMISILVEQTFEIFKARSVRLFLREQDELILYGAKGKGTNKIGLPFSFEKNTPFWSAVSSGEPIYMSDENDQNRNENSNFNRSKKPTPGAQVFIPLKAINAVVGLLNITFKEAIIEISDEKKHLLIALAEMAGNALNRASVMATLEQRVVERTRNLSILYDVSAVANQNLDLNAMLEQLLAKVLETINSKTGYIQLLDNTTTSLVLAAQHCLPLDAMAIIANMPVRNETWDLSDLLKENSEPLVIPAIEKEERIPPIFRNKPGFRTFIGIPIKSKGEALGLLSIFGEGIQNYTAEDIGLLITIADQIGNTVDNARLHKQSEEIAVLDERQRLARELHDSVTQAIYSVTLMANAARKLSANGMTKRAEYYLDELGSTAQQALKEMRLLIYELRPSALESEGLREALHQRLETVERRAGIDARLSYNAPLELPPNIEEGLYRITLEALNNALKHAQATLITVSVDVIDNQLILQIIDNGIGFDQNTIQQKSGIGLNSMRERVEKLGGILQMTSNSESGGTTVKAKIRL